MRGWEFTLADGSRYAWSEHDGVRSEAEARARLLQVEPSAVIVRVESQRVVFSVQLGEKLMGGWWLGRRLIQVAIVVAALNLLPPALGLGHLGGGWFLLAGVLVSAFDPIGRLR